MKVEITARNFTLNDKVKSHVESELNKLDKLFDGVFESHVILEKVKNDNIAEIILRVYRQNLVTKSTSDDIFKAIDESAEKARRRLKKFKAKIRDFDHETPQMEEEE